MKNQIDDVVGQRIRALRTAQGMTQADLGERVGVAFQQIQKYENGTNRVSASRLLAIARALNVPIGHFFEGIEPTSPEGSGGASGDRTPTHVDEELMALAQDFVHLTPPQRRAIMSLVRSLAAPAPDSSRERLDGL